MNGEYLDYDEKARLCDRFGLAMVPYLYRGPFSGAVVEHRRTVPRPSATPSTPGASRDGRVSSSPRSGNASWMYSRGRCILKSVSADYLDRKDAQDNKN